jgi:hypothetical protein
LGDQVYIDEAGEAFGSIRDIGAASLRIYVEGAGDFEVSDEAVAAVHDGKVLLSPGRLNSVLRAAIRRAHVSEDQ